MAKEAKARIKINKLLEEAGWRFFDDESGKANIQLESNVRITENQLDEFGEDFEKTKNGYIDFLLLDEEGFPIAVLEAKREGKKPLDAKEQARAYARGVHARFVILSNGNLHYFWDTETGNPEVITKFPSQKSIGHKRQFKPNSANLVREIIDNDYVLLTQKPDYGSDPRWLDESQRMDFLKDNGLMLLREYQKRAVHSIQRAVNEGNSRFLFEMATGTGKTLIAAAVIKLFLRTSNAKRVLFLVDRIELENQAWRAFNRYLKNDYDTVIYKQHRDDWQSGEIVVTTIQSLLSDNKYKSLFSPTDFDLLISDEAHRSIGGNSRAVFEYFIGYKLGLTATPKDYLKNIANINERDPREIERRILLDTYETFGCESGVPTFRYSLVDGVKEKFLVSPTVVDARTEITTQLLSDQGYSVIVTDQDGEDKEAIFTQRDFERKFLSEETNKAFCKVFMENALRDPLSTEIGKTIMFCVSQDHASKITQYLNEIAHNLWPGKYNSDFALQVTSAITGAQQFSINFANNNLNGHTRWLDTYKSSRTRVCVTVGMMTTGYDCEDIKNLCFMRPVFSPSDFVQMKGRGTRRFTFKYTSKDGAGKTEVFTKEKKSYKLFDFFGNCEYFEENFNYDEVIELPPTGGVTDVEGPPPVHIPDYENVSPDPLKTLEQTPIGVDGMRVDRELFGRFEHTVKKDEFVRQTIEDGDFEAAEAYILQHIFDKPEEFFNLEKLRKSVQLDRRLTLREILEKIFGMIPGFKSKEQLLDEECDKFISIYKPDSDYVLPVRNFLKAYVTEEQVRDIMRTKEYAKFFTMPVGEDFIELPPQMRETIPEYVKDYVPLNRYI